MTARDFFYNDIRNYTHDQTVGFPADQTHSLGDEFRKHLTYVVFPLSHSVWKALNDKHNRRGEAPNPEFSVFFGRKILGHKADKPCFTTVVRYL